MVARGKGQLGSLGRTFIHCVFKMDKYLPELFSIMWQLGQEGSLGESGHMYMYG